MQTITIRFTDFNGRGQQTIIRAENGAKAFRWAIENIPTLNPRKRLYALPRDDNHAEHFRWS